MTVPPGASGLPPGRVPLDGPPPAPQPMPVAPAGYGGLGGASPEDPAKSQMKGLAEAAQTVDQVLMTFAQSLPQGAKEFGLARQFVEQGLSKGLAALGGTGEVTPTSAGDQFPGGGFSSVGATGT